ncbi:hypothetical protein PTKIN_Ptkin06aG0209300 [Pterospermum kingtungense]
MMIFAWTFMSADPNAEVIALSPKTLLATNRFVCEICNKGFQRDQNLQLHRRGHNLPWKLRQRTSTETRKRVYVCPEPSCVHHNPARALGDLTGVKKHFCRKHGEKKWKCDKCSKKYAVKSDWKAHSKTCGTREYKCDCGTIFSRRDSFITHRAFCDALAEENNKASQGLIVANLGSNLQQQGQVPSTIPINNNNIMIPTTSSMNNNVSADTKSPLLQPLSMFSNSSSTHVSNSSSISSGLQLNSNSSTTTTTTLLEGNNNGDMFSGSAASMSATALLQKASQMGATASAGSLLMGKSSFTTSMMAPPCFASMQTQNNNDNQSQVLGGGVGFTSQFMQKNQQAQSDQISSAVNNMGMFSRTSTGLSGFNGDTMTVDFLGINGGSSPRSLLEKQYLQHQQQQDLDQFGGIGQARVLQGLSHFQQHAVLEKTMWKV